MKKIIWLDLFYTVVREGSKISIYWLKEISFLSSHLILSFLGHLEKWCYCKTLQTGEMHIYWEKLLSIYVMYMAFSHLFVPSGVFCNLNFLLTCLEVVYRCRAFDALELFSVSDSRYNLDVTFDYTSINIPVSSVHYTTIFFHLKIGRLMLALKIIW